MSNENRFADLSDEQLMILHSISETSKWIFEAKGQLALSRFSIKSRLN